MSDQAEELRRRVQSRPGVATLTLGVRGALPPASKPRSVVLTSGKGGVGTSNLALNLAIALGDRGFRVLLVDADLGLANLDLLCGLSPACDLGDVLAGDRALAEAIVPGPSGIRLIPGAHASRTLIEGPGDVSGRLIHELSRLEAGIDFLLVDAGSGLSPSIGRLAGSADEVVVVTTPEPTSMADAHASIRRFRLLADPPEIRAVVNQARSRAEAVETLARLAASSRQFLGAVVDPLGSVRSDPRVPLAVRSRRPFSTAYPNAPASRDIRRLARTLVDRGRVPDRSRRPGFFASLAARWVAGRSAG
jgi:flagellar biosynthesis protein FlhG